jgi:hypothetical protein
MKKLQNINPFSDIDRLIDGLQKEDNRNIKIVRNFQWVMWVLVPIYIAIFFIDSDEGFVWFGRIGGLCYALAFASFALVFRKLYNEYKSVDYGVSTVEMLTQAVKRYNLFQRKLVLVIAPVLLVDAGMVLVSYHHTDATSVLNLILWVQALLIPSFAIGLTIGILIWRKRQKPLRDAALAMLKEINS